jgi:glycosyltransferase involved in cell wall biosynthesis
VDLIVYSHLRWNFVYQRPQHLLSRFAARGWRVFFIEEPVEGDSTLDVTTVDGGVTIIRPAIPLALARGEREALQRTLVQRELRRRRVERAAAWFYTPMGLPILEGLPTSLVVYDCMDELSAFAGADPALREREARLLARADLVFTGGRSLYDAKRDRHAEVHCFPSSVDIAHYVHARGWRDERPDQAAIARPRLGYFGVIDERFDAELIEGMAELAPGWSLVMVGPIVKIDPAMLPRRPNIHYLGQKSYTDLPAYIATWDVALIPFARNHATRYLSPTKVLEYMAAGKPIVSTSIADIVTPYGEKRLVRIADTPFLAVAAAREAMIEDRQSRLDAFDRYLAGTSWDRTVAEMEHLMNQKLASRTDASDQAAAAAD